MFPSDGVRNPDQSQQLYPGAWPHLQHLLHRHGKIITLRFQILGLFSRHEIKGVLPEIKPFVFAAWILLPFLECLHDHKPMMAYRVCFSAPPFPLPGCLWIARVPKAELLSALCVSLVVGGQEDCVCSPSNLRLSWWLDSPCEGCRWVTFSSRDRLWEGAHASVGGDGDEGIQSLASSQALALQRQLQVDF